MNLLPKTQAKERRFNIDLKLTENQTNINKNSKRFTFLRAGRKYGKTKYSEWKALQWLSQPSAVHWHIAPTYKQAKLISWDSFKKLIPEQAIAKRPNDSDLIIQLKNRASLYLMGSDEENSLRGPAPTSVTFEEAAFHKPDVWSRVIRPNLTVHRAPALFISSPNGFNWFKDLEDEALARIAAGDDEWAVFHRTIYDNPYIDREEIEKIKSQCDPRVWSQEYMANYESSVGRVFYAYQDTERHMRIFPLPSPREDCYRSIDWGLRDDTAVLWGVVRDKKLHIYREQAESGIPASGQARIVKNRTPASEHVKMSIIGHDASRNDSEMRGLTVHYHFVQAGVTPLRVGGKNKEANRDRIHQLLEEDRLLIHPECRKLRKQLLSYSWKDTAMEKTEDGGDDLVDSLHSMVEMLQFELFSAYSAKKEKSLEQIQKEVRDEIYRMAHHPRISMEPESSESYLLGDLHAGYK